MKSSQVEVVKLRLRGGVAAFLADVRLGTPLFIGKLQLDAVHFAGVRLQRTTLRERLVALVAAIWTNSCIKKHSQLRHVHTCFRNRILCIR